jgi:Arc/MetJ-type ribon-helix-helix transcriptional regulator
MTIQLKPEQERIIREEIESGHFRSPEEVLDHALAALREKNPSLQTEPKKSRRNLVDVLSEPPFAGSELDLKRIRDYPRSLDL